MLQAALDSETDDDLLLTWTSVCVNGRHQHKLRSVVTSALHVLDRDDNPPTTIERGRLGATKSVLKTGFMKVIAGQILKVILIHRVIFLLNLI